MPIAIVNLGETRADRLATLRVEGRSAAVPGELATLLAWRPPGACCQPVITQVARRPGKVDLVAAAASAKAE